MLALTEFQWIIAAIGWTILHSLWQFSIIGLLWIAGISIINKANASSRYICSIIALFSMVAVSSVTLFSELQHRSLAESQILLTENSGDIVVDIPTEANSLAFVPKDTNSLPIENETVVTPTIPKWISSSVLLFLVGIWCCGILFFGIRFLVQWLSMRRLATSDTSIFAPEQLAIFKQLQNNVGIKKGITFLQSARIATPLTFGHFKPVVLLPLGMISGFPPKQIEAIILHELAHIRRNDFLINLIQIWLEVLFFYHPIVWIISKKVRTIREELCDDEVVSINKDRLLYAESLLNLQKYFLHNQNQLIMNATNNKSELTNRIHRLFQTQPTTKNKKGNINAYLLGLVLLFVVASYAFSSIASLTVSVSADKMNVLYIGVNNPITVAVSGVNTENIKVESDDVSLKDIGHGHYIVNAKKEGEAILNVIAEGHALKKVSFRVKPIPTPVAMINNRKGGKISVEKMKNAESIDVILGDFIFDTKCTIEGFSMVHVESGQDPVMVGNRSGEFNKNVKRLLDKLKIKDILYFDDIKCKCPGDTEARAINSLVFKMK